MRFLLLIVFSLVLTACNKTGTSTAESSPSIFSSSVQIDGTYEDHPENPGPEHFIFKKDGEVEYHQYFTDGKLAHIKKAKYYVENQMVKFTENQNFPFDVLKIQPDGSLVNGPGVTQNWGTHLVKKK